MTTLTCDSCPETTENVGMAVGHITDNPGHTMTGADALEGTTITVSAADDDTDDDDLAYWDVDNEDWADE